MLPSQAHGTRAVHPPATLPIHLVVLLLSVKVVDTGHRFSLVNGYVSAITSFSVTVTD